MADFSNLVSNIINSVKERSSQEEDKSGGIISDIIGKIEDKADEVQETSYPQYYPQTVVDSGSYSVVQPQVEEPHPISTMSENGDEESIVKKVNEEVRHNLDENKDILPSLAPNVTTSGSDKVSKWLDDQDKKREAYNKSIVEPMQENGYYGPVLPYDEADRRLFDENGEFKQNPLDWNVLGFNSQKKTPEPVRDLYEYLFSQENPDEYQQTSTWRNNIETNPLTTDQAAQDFLYSQYAVTGSNPYDNELLAQSLQNAIGSNRPTFDPNSIDDGQSVESRESAFMTGEQYIKYRMAGLPGRPIDQIMDSPDEIYSKQDEMEQYGFIPYLTSDESVNSFHDTTAPHTVSNWFNELADLRRNMVDHKISYGGQEYSGKDFDKNLRLWSNRNDVEKQRLDPEEYNARHKIITENPGEFDIPQSMVMYDQDGNRYVAPNNPINMYTTQSGKIVIQFNDNPDDDWVFEDEEDLKNTSGYEQSADGDWIAAWETGWEPLTLDSGQKIRADDAWNIGQNYDQYVDYGFGNFSKPNPGGILESPQDILPQFVDMVLSSAPYFYLPASATKGIAGAAGGAQGVRPGYRDANTGTYDLLSENPNFSEVASSVIGESAMPFTEHLWGPLGRTAFKMSPTEAILGNTIGKAFPAFNGALRSTPGRVITGASDEGLEEIPGNIMEELINSGMGWYASDKEDNGRVERDRQNRAKKEDSNLFTRLSNFLADAPEAYAGGAMLGGVLGLKDVPDYMNENRKLKEEKSKFGYNHINNEIDYDALINSSSLNDMERRYYDRGRM